MKFLRKSWISVPEEDCYFAEIPFILYPAPNRFGLSDWSKPKAEIRVYDQKCSFSHGRIRNILFRTEAGVYIKKILLSTLPRVPERQKNQFFPAYQGIYKKFVCQYPADRKKVDMERQFFCIYPVYPSKLGIKGRTCKTAGYCGTIILYIPCRIK